MPRKTATFAPSGVVLDEVPPACAPDVYTGCNNWRVQSAGMQLASGQVVLHSATIQPKFGMLAPVDAIGYSLLMGDGGVSISDGGAQVATVLPAGWGPFTAGTMTGAVLGGVAAFNYRGAPPWYWDTTLAGAFVKPLPGWIAGKQARVIGTFGQHLFAGGLYGAIVEDEQVAWSDAAVAGTVPASWVPTLTNQAGQLGLSTGKGPIQVMQSLANSLMVWRSEGLFAIDYVGRPYIYTSRLVASHSGAASMNCVLNVKGTQVVLSAGDIVQTDGVQVRSIGEGRLKEWLFSQMSRAGLALAHGYVDTAASEAVFCVALGRDDRCNFALAWNFERDKWSVRELPESVHTWMGLKAQGGPLLWDDDAGSYDGDTGFWDEGIPGGYQLKPFAACVEKGVLVLNQGSQRWTGENIVGTLERTGLKISDGDRIAKVQRVIPAIEGSPGTVIGIQVGAQLAANGPVSWGPAQDFILGQSVKHDCNARGRFVAIRFTCAGPQQPTIAGFSFEYDDGGRQ